MSSFLAQSAVWVWRKEMSMAKASKKSPEEKLRAV